MISAEGLFHRLSAIGWTEFAQRLIPWLNALLVLMLAYVMAGLSWRAWPQAGAGHPLIAVELPASQLAGGRAVTLDAVAKLHLFGQAESPQESAPQQAVVDAPETRLSLTLRGIIALSSGGVGRALIAEGSAQEKLFKVGDTLSGSAVLHEVQVDRVILKRNGRFETLTLPRERLESTGGPGAGHGNQTRGPISKRIRQLRTLRDDIAANPQLAFSLIQAQPVMEGDKIKGYRVNPGRQRQLFQGTGLRPGDVVTHVNGIALGDAAQTATLFAQFKSAERFDLTVERRGQPTSLSIDLGQ